MRMILGKPKMSFKAFLFLFVILAVSFPFIIYADSSTNKDSLNYIFSFQDQLSGGVKEEFIDEPQSLETDWAIMAFSSSGYNSSTVGNPKNMIDFATREACILSSITDIERRVLALESAGVDTHILGGCNLPQKIIDVTEESGQIGDSLISTVFGVLALSASDENVPSATFKFIADNQNESGGWDSGWGVESNFTSQAIMALALSNQEVDPEVFVKAKNYLKSLQTNSGGIKYDDGEWSVESDAFSDSYALQAIYSLGESPNDYYWLQDGNSILNDLESLRNDDGSFSFSSLYGKMNPVWTTSVALIGINQSFLPIDKSDLISWIGKIAIPSPKPAVSAGPSPSPNLSPNPTVSVTLVPSLTPSPDQDQIDPIESSIVAESKNEPESISITANHQQMPENMPSDLVQSSTDTQRVLSDTVSRLKSEWQWIITVLVFSFLTGILIAFVENKYVKIYK